MNEKNITMISTGLIREHAENPRKDKGDLTELTDSIRENGIYQNLTVVPADEEGCYTVVIGHRRLAAAKLAGVTEVPCVITEMSYQQQIETMLLENMQRSDLTPYEQAKGFQQLSFNFGQSVEEISKKTGFSTTTIRHRLKMAEIDDETAKEGSDKGATIFDFMALEGIRNIDKRNSVAKYLGTNNFSNNLKWALEEQEREDRFSDLVEAAKEIAKPLPENRPEGYSAIYFSIYSHDNVIEIPEDADTDADIYYEANTYNVTLYYLRKHDESEQEAVDEKKTVAKDYVTWMENAISEATMKEEHFCQLRMDYLKNFNADRKFQEELIKALAEMTYVKTTGSGYYCSKKNIVSVQSNVLGIKTDKPEHSYDDPKLNEESLKKKCEERPLFATFVLTYATLDAFTQGIFNHSYDSSCTHQVINKNDAHVESLKVVYRALKRIGYVMSDEEIDYLNGKYAESVLVNEPERALKQSA